MKSDRWFVRIVPRAMLLALVAVGPGAHSAENPASTSASSPPSLTLEQAIGLALENNPSVRASSGRIVAAAGRAYQAGLWSNPELEVSAEEWPVGVGDGLADATQLVGVAQTVPWPGKKRLEARIGTSGVLLSQTDLELRRRELVREVKTAFSQALASEQLEAAAGELVSLASDAAEAAGKRVLAGAAADQEQLRTEVTLEQARTELAGFSGDLAMARETLAALLGLPDLRVAKLDGSLDLVPDSGPLEQNPATWLSKHPAVMAARLTLDRSHLEERRARLEPYPDVRFGIAAGRNGAADASIVQFRISMPLPIIDRSRGRKHEAAANVSVSEAELLGLEQRLMRDWRTARQRVRTAEVQVSSYRDRILPKAGEALRLVRSGFDQGKFGLIDLLDTQRTWAEVRLAYQQRLLELHSAHATLEALVETPRPTRPHPVAPSTSPSTPAPTPTPTPAPTPPIP